ARSAQTIAGGEQKDAERISDQEDLPSTVSPASKPASGSQTFSGFAWTGEVPAQKWMNFYTRVLAKFSAAKGMKLTVKVEITPEGGVSKQKIDETKKALGELGLQQELEFEQHD